MIVGAEVAAGIHDYSVVHEVEVNVKVADEARQVCGV